MACASLLVTLELALEVDDVMLPVADELAPEVAEPAPTTLDPADEMDVVPPNSCMPSSVLAENGFPSMHTSTAGPACWKQTTWNDQQV